MQNAQSGSSKTGAGTQDRHHHMRVTKTLNAKAKHRICTMASFLNTLRTAAKKRADYNRTVAELSAISTQLAVEDLGFYPGDAAKMAKHAVYGR